MSGKPSGGIYLEFVTQGAFVKATAIDPESGIEASIVAPVGTTQFELERVAVQKLNYVLEKRTPKTSAPHDGKGIVA